MKKELSILIALLLSATLVGCTSPGRNPAGVRGSAGQMGQLEQFDFDTAGTIPLPERFSGGAEYPGMFEAVYFAYDSSQVSPSERAKIENIANLLKADNSKCVIVDGHCDERGSIVYNQNLSEKRALAIRSYLTGLGIDSDRIQTRGYGEEVPAAAGHNESAWGRNRRGEFVLYY
jgi:peptidoglycan-associated lipoprotein